MAGSQHCRFVNSLTTPSCLTTPPLPRLARIFVMAPTCRILVMASGNGSNFQALIDAVADGRIPNSSIVQLVVNRGKAYATTRADNSSIPWEYFNLIAHGFQAKTDKDPESIQQARNKYDAALAKKILESDQRPDLIVLAGWMYIFGEHFLDPISKAGIRIINLHPALPGELPLPASTRPVHSQVRRQIRWRKRHRASL